MKKMTFGHFVAVILLVVGMAYANAAPTGVLPTGGSVSSGSASIGLTNPSTLTISQLSNTAIINWNSFSIASGYTTNFNYLGQSGNAAVLNRVSASGGTSVINGTLTGNEAVYLVNGNGILIGPGGVVNTNGFTASTRDIADSDFLSGNLHFTGSGSAGVVNQGTISALGGDVYLIGKTVDNQGTITAANGTVGLASADDVVLNLNGQEHVFVNPSPTASSASSLTAVNNSGTIAAASAELKAANGNMFALAINNAGTVRATSVSNKGGRIFLTTDSGLVQNTGTLAAKSGNNGGSVSIKGGSVWNQKTIDASGAQGGAVTVDSENFQNDGTISVQGTQGAGGSFAATFSGNALGSVTGVIDASGATQGGSIQFLGTGLTSEAYLSLTLNANSLNGAGGTIELDSPILYLAGATLSANGATQGGGIYVGEAAPQFGQTLSYAQTAYVSAGTSLKADAVSGNGGQIKVASTNPSQFYGSAEANGGTVQTALTQPSPSDAPAAPFEFVDPDPSSGDLFGRPTTGIFSLASNNTLITAPGDSFGGSAAGAVYLFSNTNGALLSTLRGSHANDAIGTTVLTLTGGNFAVVAPNWNSTVGAVTFGNGMTGFANGGGAVSASNSLVGSASGDQVGSGGLVRLFSGDYLVLSPEWNSAAGAVTWVNPANGLNGAIGAGNSLVGAAAGDQIGSAGILQLSNGSNYLVLSPEWSEGAGAITNGSDTTGVIGIVSAANSLVGASSGDGVGANGTVDDTALGYYLVVTPTWNGGAGAVTWSSDLLGTVGTVSASNSLVGSTGGDGGDSIGSGGITLLYSNRNYLVSSPNWNGGAGAVTLGNGATGITGVVSSENSLVGASSGDSIGSGGIAVLSGAAGYVVSSPNWNNNAGAVSWGNDTAGITGVVGASNSLVGSTSGVENGDQIGSGGLVTLGNGSFLILSPYFASSAGAVTWESLTNRKLGVVSSSNSLVGASAGDSIGSDGIYQLSNTANYLVLSPLWGGGKGAVTDGSESGGVTGVVSSENSLVGASTGDGVGAANSITDPFTDYYLVSTPNWGGGAGAVTWGSDSHGVTGVVSASNSLVGSAAGDNIGSGGVTLLYNGNYVVVSPNWNSLTGAVTWGSGTSGVTGVVSSANSLVGASQGDEVGSGGIFQLSNGQNFLVQSPLWGGGAGAITNINSSTGATGIVSASNSLVGASTSDGVGAANSIIDPYTGYYLVSTENWGGDAGAVTWNSDSAGATGVVSAANSLVGRSGLGGGSIISSTGGDHIGSGGITILNNGNYVVDSPEWNNASGAVTWGSAASGVDGVVSAANSLVGVNIDGELLISRNSDNGIITVVSNGDQIGSGGVTFLPNSNYLVLSPQFGGGAGAVTWVNGATGITGTVSASNSLIGAAAGDSIGSGGIFQLSNQANFLVLSPLFNGGAGAVTNGSDATGVTGVVSSENSLVGAASTDGVGSSGSILDSNLGYYLVKTANWGSGAGAVTWNSDTAGTVGTVSASNSLVGAIHGESADSIGSGGITLLNNGNYLVESPNWNGQAGAVTWGSATGGVTGVVSAANSLVGTEGGQTIGSGGITQLPNGNYVVVSPLFGSANGAVTLGQGSTGTSGYVSTANSLVGAYSSDEIGSGGITVLADGNYLINSPRYRLGAGAVTWGSETTGVTGVISPANSLLGKHISDHLGSGGIVLLPNGDYLVQSPFYATSAGAVTWGDEATGIDGYVGPSNSITGGMANSGEQYVGLSANDSLYLVAFTGDKSQGGDGRVLAGSVGGPPQTTTPSQNFFMDQSVITFSTSGFNPIHSSAQFDVTDPGNLTFDAYTIGVISGGAINDGKGGNLASGSSTSGAPGPQRLVVPGNGVWNIFGGTVHSQSPPWFVNQQFDLNLSPSVLASLQGIVFGHP